MTTFKISANGIVHAEGCGHADAVKYLSGGHATVEIALAIAREDFERPGQAVAAPCAKAVPVPAAPKMVYGSRGWRSGQQARVVAAVDSIAEFCRVTGISRNEATVYGGPTGNPAEVMTAKANPRTALFRDTMAQSDAPFFTAEGKRIDSWSAITTVTITLTAAQLERLGMHNVGRDIREIIDNAGREIHA